MKQLHRDARALAILVICWALYVAGGLWLLPQVVR